MYMYMYYVKIIGNRLYRGSDPAWTAPECWWFSFVWFVERLFAAGEILFLPPSYTTVWLLQVKKNRYRLLLSDGQALPVG